MITTKLIASATTVVILLGGMHAMLAETALPRESIKTFSQDATKLAKLRAAVAALKARDLNFDDPTSWFNMAGIHGISSNDPNLGKIPAAIQALLNQCHRD